MGKYVTVVCGMAALAAGFWSLAAVWPLLWKAVRVIAPLMLIIGGAFAMVIGLAEIRDSIASRAEKDQSTPSASEQS